MCTAATYKTKDFYFGRTLDYEFSYGEQIAVTPRNYPFHFRHMGDVAKHYAIIGMAHVAADYPLYYDAVNEKGVGMAGLNFVGNAYFPEVTEGKENVASFEFIPWVLGQCANMKEVRELLAKINITGTPFAENMPAASLHWIIADADEAVTRVAFTKMNSVSGDSEEESVGQFFHILGSVEQQRGCCEVAEGKYEITIYTSCCNATKGIYYYTTYTNRQITAVDMHREDLDGSGLIHYPMLEKEQILRQN